VSHDDLSPLGPLKGAELVKGNGLGRSLTAGVNAWARENEPLQYLLKFGL
jgi:hypothetical protein